MSIQAVAFILDMEVLEVPAKMLLVCLANAHNQDTGLCHPSIRRLERESGMSSRSIIRWLKWLEEKGYIEKQSAYDKSGRQTANDYRLVDFTGGVSLSPRGASVGTGEGVTVVTLGGDTVGTPLKKPEEYRKKEPTAQRAGLPEDDRDFQENLWAEFPRHENSRRLPALKAFLRLSQADRVACIRGAARYSMRFEDDKADKRPLEERLRYVPHLVTWINQRGWEAELERS